MVIIFGELKVRNPKGLIVPRVLAIEANAHGEVLVGSVVDGHRRSFLSLFGLFGRALSNLGRALSNLGRLLRGLANSLALAL
jgi:aminoglycoside phosphotransferase